MILPGYVCFILSKEVFLFSTISLKWHWGVAEAIDRTNNHGAYGFY